MKRALLRARPNTEGTLVMAVFCNKTILMHFHMALLSSFLQPYFSSLHFFSFLQPPTWIGTASNTNNTYLHSTLQACFYFYTIAQ